jgi:hypothetical protein
VIPSSLKLLEKSGGVASHNGAGDSNSGRSLERLGAVPSTRFLCSTQPLAPRRGRSGRSIVSSPGSASRSVSPREEDAPCATRTRPSWVSFSIRPQPPPAPSTDVGGTGSGPDHNDRVDSGHGPAPIAGGQRPQPELLGRLVVSRRREGAAPNLPTRRPIGSVPVFPLRPVQRPGAPATRPPANSCPR